MIQRTLIFDGVTPPSLNAIGYRSHWAVGRRHKLRWQQDIATMLMARRVPRGLARVEASAVLRFPVRRRRDSGNFRTLLEKSLGDALVEGGWLPDDTPEFFEFGAVAFTEGAARTSLMLRCWLGDRDV